MVYIPIASQKKEIICTFYDVLSKEIRHIQLLFISLTQK